MRLKTLRKERPALEAEGAVISGSRMDLSNSDQKPLKYRCHNTLVKATSHPSDSNSFINSPTERIRESTARRQKSEREPPAIPPPSEETMTPSYQAIEAAYLEHGIRIRLTPQATVHQSTPVAEILSGRKQNPNIQRHKAFVSRKPSGISSVLHYSTADLNRMSHDARSFSALQHNSTAEFDRNHLHNVSYEAPIDNHQQLLPPSVEETNHDDCSPLIVASEHFHSVMTAETLPINTDTTATIMTTAMIENDPDLAYMSSLLKQSTGDSFRDTIRRRAGLRATFAVHRNPSATIPTTTTTTTTKKRQKSLIMDSSSTYHRNSLTRNTTIANPIPPSHPPSQKKIEKDIVKHASRIRNTTQLKDHLTVPQHHQNSMTTQNDEHTRPVTTRSNSIKHKVHKQLTSFSLEPLELLLAPAPRPQPTRVTSQAPYDLPDINIFSLTRSNTYHSNRKMKTTTSTVESQTQLCGVTNNLLLSEQSHSSLIRNESLPLMKISPLDIVPTHQSSSLDSGCYDQSSSTGDIHSRASSSLMRAPSSMPSARLTSASTRRSNATKKVSFDDAPLATMVLSTATYV